MDGYFMKYFYILRNMNDDFRPKSDRKGGNSGSTGNKHILKKNQCCLFIYLFFKNVKNVIPKTMIFCYFYKLTTRIQPKKHKTDLF